jgi:Domain of unknown function (DUF4345)
MYIAPASNPLCLSRKRLMNQNERLLAQLSTVNGVACLLIGLYHLLGGVSRTTPGAGPVTASIDSQERFFASVFAGYGLAWLRTAHAKPVAAADVVTLSSIMAVGGLGRLLSWKQHGRPHALYVVLTIIEFVTPAVILKALQRGRAADAS